MKKGYAEKAIREHILPNVQGYQLQKRMLYRAPLEWILSGYYFDRGSEKGSMRVYVFVQPLYVPKDDVHFTLGSSLGGLSAGSSTWWRIDPSNEHAVMHEVLLAIRCEGEPYLARFQDPDDVARRIDELGSLRNIHVHDALASSLALAGHFSDALRELKRLKAENQEDLHIQWVAEVLKRADDIAQAISEGPESVLSLMRRLRRGTLEAIKLSAEAVDENELTLSSPKSRWSIW